MKETLSKKLFSHVLLPKVPTPCEVCHFHQLCWLSGWCWLAKRAQSSAIDGTASELQPFCCYSSETTLSSSSCPSMFKLKGRSGDSSWGRNGTLNSSAHESVTATSGHRRPKGPYDGCIPWGSNLDNRWVWALTGVPGHLLASPRMAFGHP